MRTKNPNIIPIHDSKERYNEYMRDYYKNRKNARKEILANLASKCEMLKSAIDDSNSTAKFLADDLLKDIQDINPNKFKSTTY